MRISKIKIVFILAFIGSVFFIACSENEMPKQEVFNTASIEKKMAENKIEQALMAEDTPTDDGGCHEEDAERLAKERGINYAPDKKNTV